MKLRSRRAATCLALILSCLTLPASLLWAQNENETVGFQTNHAFEGASLGDNIDVMNGSLTLTIPIGPTYQLNQNFGYQLQMSYGSKIWSEAAQDYNQEAGLYRRSSMGLGFAMHFGRIYRDIEVRERNGNPAYFCDWYYESPDGNQHVLPGDNADARSCENYPTSVYTIDNTFYAIGGTFGLKKPPPDGEPGPGWDCSLATVPTLNVTTPDGIRYTFSHYVSAKDGAGREFNCTVNTVTTYLDDRYREYNRDFGGWYVSLIEDTKSAWITITDPRSARYVAPPGAPQSGHAVWVELKYESASGFDHAINEIIDSAGRRIKFHNACVPPPAGVTTPSGCDEIDIVANPPNRYAVRTDWISVPKYMGTPAVVDSDPPADPTPRTQPAQSMSSSTSTTGPLRILVTRPGWRRP